MNDFAKILSHANLEEEIPMIASIKEYQSLGLQLSTYPRVYQRLPRYTLPGFPKNAFIKEEFSCQKTLRKRFVDSALLSLYRDVKLKKTHHIVLLTHVIPDGLGDLYAQKTTYTLLKNRFPNCSFTLVTFIHQQSHFSHDDIQDPWFIYHYKWKKDLEIDKLDPTLFETLRKASLVLQIPTYFSFFDDLKAKIESLDLANPLPAFESVGEYGFINSKDFHPMTNTRCLGLHFLEKGLFLDAELSKKAEQIQFSSSILDLTKLKESSKLFVAYLDTEMGYQTYLHLVLHSCRENTQDITILAIDIGKFFKAIELILQDLEKLSTFKISKIELYFNQNTSVIPISNEGKTLRIYHTGFLKHEDFTKLLSISESPVGIRGNLSLTEAISLKKLYFYDLLEHNETLMNGLLSIAKQDAKKAYDYLHLAAQKNKQIDLICQKYEDAKGDFQNLNEFLLQNYNAGFDLENLVSRALYQQENAHIQKIEQELLEKFSEKKETFANFITKVQEKINEVT